MWITPPSFAEFSPTRRRSRSGSGRTCGRATARGRQALAALGPPIGIGIVMVGHPLPYIAREIQVAIRPGARSTGADVRGMAVNIGARIESLTKEKPDSVLISESTFRIIGDAFDVSAWDPVTVKGKDDPITVYEVFGAR